MDFKKRLWIGLLIMAVITPLGLIVPEMFKAGSAWGEWDAETIQKMIGYIPTGFKRFTNLWSAPIPDYTLSGNASAPGQAFFYIVSAIVGIALIYIFVNLLSRVFLRHDK